MLSTNAAPISGISIERNFSDPFESKLLNWIGPWDFSLILGDLEHSRTQSDTLFFGMRVGLRPLTNLEIGLSKTSLFCGENRNCDLTSFSDMLLDKSNSVYNLTGFDFRSSHHIRTIPFALYVTRQIFKNYESRSIKDAMAGTIGLHFLTGVLMVVGVSIF